MKYNYLCKYYVDNVKCKHEDKCCFVHNLDKLEKKACKFKNCKLVYQVMKGIYYNRVSEKRCPFWHPNEIRKSYGARMGMRFNSKEYIKKYSKNQKELNLNNNKTKCYFNNISEYTNPISIFVSVAN